MNQAAGAAQDLYGQAEDTASDAAETVRQGAMDAEDYIRRPSRSALIRWLSSRFVPAG